MSALICSTHATHHCLSKQHVINPEISSKATSFSLTVTLSSFETVESFVITISLDFGMKQ